MELKVLCDCGQNFKFDVEPANGRMPFKVNCPFCNEDVAAKANALIAENLPVSPRLPPAVPPGYPLRPAVVVADKPGVVGEFNLGLGILGAALGAALGAGLMYAFFAWAHFRFPLMGPCIGVLTGLGARMFYNGTNCTLGGIAAAIAVLATCGTLYLMFGTIEVIFLIFIGISGYFAYQVAG